MSKIRFQVLPPIAHPEETIIVTGGPAGFGHWQPAQGLRLRWEPPYHIGEYEAERETRFEYKIVRGSWEAEAVDAYGHVPPNHVHDVWLDATVHHTIADWKDRFRGRLTHDQAHSRVLAGARDLLVWLPPAYATDPARRFPLVILHDGANVFDPATSPLTRVDWAADEWVSLLAGEGVMPEAIVVGVCHPEGFSEQNITLRDNDLSPELGGAAYAQFLVTDLIAHMDTRYRTLARPESRLLAGASLGGLISFYTAIHYPGVFGKVACLSTSFEDVSQKLPRDAAELHALEALTALPDQVKIFFDYGTAGLDECYEPYHAELGSLLREKGWYDGRQFQIARVEGGSHSEISWRARFGAALRFLAQ